MADKKPAKKATRKSPKKTAGKAYMGFSAEERAAMKEYARERKAQALNQNGEEQLREAIAKMQEPDRTMAKRLHRIVKATAPTLSPRTWYGMPAYAKDGKVICFFRDAHKFKERYAMLGFNDGATLDDGAMWPVAYALERLSGPEEKKITALLKKALG